MRLIDADALFTKQKSHADLFKGSDKHDDIIRRDEATMALAEIQNAPTIEAELVLHGRWDEIVCFSEHGIPMAQYECTNCGNDIERQRGVVPAYCEFCGAKMDGGADNA